MHTRWGRTTCPADQNVIYKGYVGGSEVSSRTPSATTILCLPEDPVYANFTTTGHHSYVFGSQYETGIDPGAGPFKNFLHEDAPCVVCQPDSKGSVFMLPGRNQCYPGWTLEYWGYLIGPHDGQGSSEIICVDPDAEAVSGGKANVQGHPLWRMEGACGVLPCPPYEIYWELFAVSS